MEKNEIRAKAVVIIKETLPELADIIAFDDKTPINTDKGLDSMTFVYLMTRLEDEFGVTVPQKKWRKISTLGQLVDALYDAQSK